MKNASSKLIRTTAAMLIVAVSTGGTLSPDNARAQTPKFANPAFERLWQRTDLPVQRNLASRSWYWGPQPGVSMQESSQSAHGSHLVQYFDKARMEINDPSGNPNSPWYVTNGLLTVEMISGVIDGQATLAEPGPPEIPVASDPEDANAPTYRSFASVADVPGNSGHEARNAVGQYAVATIDRAGHVGEDRSKQRLGDDVRYAYYEVATKHNIPGAFRDFLNRVDLVYENGQTKLRLLSDPWYYASGYPISEAYWAKATIAGQQHEVMIQAFQRRVLTYVPDNPPAWRVQMGNIGQHYYQWRYGGQPGPTPTPQPPAGQAPGRIAFVSDRSAGSGIFSMKPDGTDIRQVAQPEGSSFAPRFAPKGTRIAYTNMPPSPMGRRPLFPPLLDPISRIMIADDASKGEGLPLGATSIASWDGQADPAFSPDGIFLAFRGRPTGQQAGIFIANLASEAPVIPVRRLTTGEWDRQPAWNPTGTALAYTSGPAADTSQVWSVNVDGSGKKRLTDQVPAILDQDPAWSPDGKTLGYSSNGPAGKFEIMLMRPDGTDARSLLYVEGGNLRHPSFSPDGNWLAFSYDKDGNSEIYVAAADASRWTNISNSPSQDSEPSWGTGK